jgi:hypothetical protein
MIRVVHPGSGSGFFFTHPGSRGQKGTEFRIRNTELDRVLMTDLLVLTVLWWAGVAWLRPCRLLQVGGHQLTVQRWLDFQLLATPTCIISL